MPGFIIHTGSIHFALAPEARKKLVVERIDGNNFIAERRVVNKFMNDRVFLDTDDYTVIVEGVILNNHELMDKYSSNSWASCVIKMYEANGETFFDSFRGSFSGALYDKAADKWIIYTGHTGEKQVFYAQVPGGYLFGSEMRFMVETLKKNKLPVTLDKTGCYMSLTYGFCIEDRTLVSGIHKLIGGHYIRLTPSGLDIIQYHRFSNKPNPDITQEEAIEGIDRLFRQAVKRQFEKDREYGFRHLACLSGGLDSRMTVWVAHEMGYFDQTNIDYSQSGCLDFSISQQIAIDLNHEYFFHPLDGGNFIPRYSFLSPVTYGNGFLMGHGYSMEEFINYEQFGLFHTGQLGDVILGSYMSIPEYSKPSIADGAYSTVIIDRLSGYNLLFEYENSELFRLYNRGLNGINQGLLSYQENTESMSPFMDIDFFSYCLSMPLELRVNHKIYIDWILCKYPTAANYVWEKTGKRIEPTVNKAHRYMDVFGNKVPHFLDPTFKKYLIGFILRRLGIRKKDQPSKTIRITTPNNMNPIDYWFLTNHGLEHFINNLWDNNNNIIPYPDLKKDMELLIKEEAVYDKLQCCNVLSAISLILSYNSK